MTETDVGLEALHNTVAHRIGAQQGRISEPQKTLIVVGPARGGTSLIAGVLAHLGVFMGTQSTSPTYEDLRLASACRTGDATQVAQVMREYDSSHEVWGYKRPAIIDHFDIVHAQARNPVYLFVFKDMFSIANRNRISMKIGIQDALHRAYQDYGKILNFVRERRPNGMLISYDRVMQDREAFVELMEGLVPDGVGQEQRANALAFIDPNPAAYLNASRITRAVGEISSLVAGRVAGRARYAAAPQRAARVEVVVDGEVRGTTQAVPMAEGWHEFTHPLDPQLEPGQTVTLRLTEDVRPFAEQTWRG